MQSISVYLYQNKIDVFTNAAAAWTTERYRRVYNRNVKIYRGVDNRIDIQVRNSDEKAADTTGSTLVFNLIERESQSLVIKKDCVLINATTGRYYVTLTQAEMQDIEQGYYQYSVYNEIRAANGTNYTVTSRTPMYIDSQYGDKATIEVGGSGQGDLIPSKEINAFNVHMSFDEGFDNYYISSIIDANPQTSTPQSLHTFQFYLNNYSGRVEIQGSLSDGGNPEIWSTVYTTDFDNKDSGYANITGKYNFFRIKHTPNRNSEKATFVISQTILLNYQVSVNDAGRGYRVGDQITINGRDLGGESTTNNLVINVTGIDGDGRITSINWTGISYNGIKTFVLSGETPSVGTFDKVLYR
jgi:hypothetical protein